MISIQRIFRDEHLIKDIVDKSSYFFELCILPELLAKWHSREQVIPAQTAAASAVSDTYTYRKEDKGGEMVGFVQTVVSCFNLHRRSKKNNVIILMYSYSICHVIKLIIRNYRFTT